MLVRGFNLLIPVITLPYILRVIGLENYGHIALSIAIATFLGSIIQYGFSISAVKEISQVRDNTADVADAFWRNFFTSLSLSVLIGALYFSMVLAIPFMQEQHVVYLGAFLLAAGNALFPHWLFLALERTHFVVVSTAATRVLYLALILVFLRAPQDYVLLNLLGAIGAWLNIAIAAYFIIGRFGLKPLAPARHHIVTTLRDGFHSFLIQWTPNLYNSASILILGLSVSPAVLGVFNAANAIITLVNSIGRLLSNAFLPILSTSLDKHNVVVRVLLGCGVFSMIIILLFAPYIATLLAPEGQEDIARNLRYIALGIPFVFGYFAYGLNYVALMSRSKTAGYSSLWISIAGMGAALALIPAFGAIGAAAVLLFTRAGLFLISYLIYRNLRHTAQP